MPLDPNKTKDGIDLNQVDVSKLAFIDKTGLKEDLTKHLNDYFGNVADDVADKVKETLGGSSGSGSGSGGGGRSSGGNSSGSGSGSGSGGSSGSGSGGSGGGSGPRRPREPKEPRRPLSDFEKALQLQERALKNTEKAIQLQRVLDRESSRKEISQKSYSKHGVRYTGEMDTVVDELHDYSPKELRDAKKQMAHTRANIKDNTLGEEQKFLLANLTSVEKALENESHRRNTMMGKIGSFFNKNNIDAVSIAGALSSNSPLAGYMAKHAMDTFRKHREKKQGDLRDSLTVGDKIYSALPRPDKADTADADVKVSSDVLRPHLVSLDEQDRYATLKNLHAKGHISTEQHDALKAELLDPDFQPMPKAGPRPQEAPRPQQEAPGQETRQQQGAPGEPRFTSDAAGNTQDAHPDPNAEYGPEPKTEPVSDYQAYHKSTSKAQQEEHEKNAWLRDLGSRFGERAKKDREEHERKPKLEDLDKESDTYKFYSDPDFMGADVYNAPPTSMHMFERLSKGMESVPPPPHFNDPAPEPERAERVHDETHADEPNTERIHFAEAALSGNPPEHETITPDRAERVSQHDAGIVAEGSGPTPVFVINQSKLEKLSEQQLAELKDISKTLRTQLENASLAAAAKGRETVDSSGDILEGSVSEKEKKGKGLGGLLGGAKDWLFDLLGLKALLRGGKVAKGAEEAEEAAKGGGMFSRLFGRFRGAGKAEKGLAGGAEALEGAEVGGGMFSKLLGGVKGLGKIGGIGKLIGKAAVPLMVIFAVVDFFEGFINAEKLLGGGKKLGVMSRVAAGLGGVVKGFFGIIDTITSLFGLKTDIGGTSGRVIAKAFDGLFKLLGWFGKTLSPVMILIGDLLRPLGFGIQAVLIVLEGMIDAFTNLAEGKSFLDPIKDTIQKILDAFMDMGRNVLAHIYSVADFFHVKHPPLPAAPNSSPSPGAPHLGGQSGPMSQSQDDIKKAIAVEAKKQKADVNIAMGLAESESTFRNINSPKEKDGKYAAGVFQFRQQTANDRKVNRDDPQDNIRGGVEYIQELYDKTKTKEHPEGNLAVAIGHYKGKAPNDPEVLTAMRLIQSYRDNPSKIPDINGPLDPPTLDPPKTENADMGWWQKLQATNDKVKDAMWGPRSYNDYGMSQYKPGPTAFSTPPPTLGLNLGRVSTESAALQRASNKPGAGPTVVAPTSNVVNNNSTQVADIRATNSESTYRRNMDQQWVPA